MSKRKILMSFAMLCMLSTAAVAEGPKAGGVVNAVIQPEPPSLMVGLVQNGPTQMVAGNIYEGLLRYSPKLDPLPGLAESWTVSEDGKIYTFKLLKGVTWHDGKPFTSADVLFSIEFLKQTHARARGNLVQLDKVEAPDESTVVFTLKQPFGPFIGIFEVGSLPMIPKHIYEGTDFKTNPANNTPVGTGPFMFKEWQKGSFIRLVKNPNYHVKGKPNIDEIYWHVIPDAAARSVAYETGKVDVLPGGSVENFDVPRLSKLKNTCVTGAGWEFFSPHSWLWLNNRSGPTANKKFRQALMFAIDRNMAKDVVWNGLGKVATGPSGSAIKYYTGAVPKYDYDPAKAKALLKEAGYNGEKLRMLPLPYGETWQRWAEMVQPEPAGRRDQRRHDRDRRPRLESKSQRVGLRHRLYLSLSVWRSRARRRPQLHLQPDRQGLAVQQRRRLFEPRNRQAVRRRRGRLPRCGARGDLRQGAEDPRRGRAGRVDARTAIPDHHPLQRQEPDHDRHRRERRFPRRLD